MVKHIHVPIPNQRSESATSHVIEEGAVGTALTVKLLKRGTLRIYDGYPHGMLTTHADVLNPDLLAFIKG